MRQPTPLQVGMRTHPRCPQHFKYGISVQNTPPQCGTHPCVSLDMTLLIIDNVTIGIYHLMATFNLVYCVSNKNLNMHLNNVNIEFPNQINISDISYVLYAHYCNTNS